jgi:pimeloyl-ACP methyl ester carboxylesterase
MEWLVDTPDGRTLAVEDAGDRDGRPVMVHVGTPGGRRLYGPRTLADAERRHLRLISYDRPGYGGSTPQPGRCMADCASDVRAICAALGIDRLPMWGLSGGGPHVLACAALLPDLVPAVASLASPAPYDAEGLDWMHGFSPAAVDEVRLTLTDQAEARALFRREREKILMTSPAQVAIDLQTGAAGAAGLAGADLALLTDEAVTIQLALAPGIEGSWDDCVAQLTPWGFDVTRITVPVLLLHGGQDRAVPFGHGQWLAAHIPCAEAWFFAEEGHTLRESHIADVHAWLVDHGVPRDRVTLPLCERGSVTRSCSGQLADGGNSS